MNHKTYMKTIADQFGGVMKEELYGKLEILANMIHKEESESHIEKKALAESMPKLAKKMEVTVSYEKMGNYEKAMSIIKSFNNVDWVHISQVPPELFNVFWAICEMHPEIEFDKERDYQYFRVKYFRVRLLDERKAI